MVKEIIKDEFFLKQKEEHNKDAEQRNRKLLESENRAKQIEQSLKDKLANTGKQEKENDELKLKLTEQIESANKKRADLRRPALHKRINCLHIV